MFKVQILLRVRATFQDMEPDIADWSAQELHRQLLNRAYNILRIAESAEDVVQEAYVRYLTHQNETILDPAAWLNTAVRNLSLDALRKLDAERRNGIDRRSDLPVDIACLAESPLDVFSRRKACREMIRRLLGVSSVKDVASVLLREVFEFSYRDIAQASRRTEPACRQAVRRTLHRAYQADLPLKVAVVQSSPLIDSRIGVFEQAIHDGNSRPLLDQLNVSLNLRAMPNSDQAVKLRWYPAMQSGELIFCLYLGSRKLCDSHGFRREKAQIDFSC